MPGAQTFVAPNCPGLLNIPNTATPIEELNNKDQHAEERRLCLESKNVEKALMRCMQDAIEDKYVESLVDEYANLISGDAPAVLQYQFYNCGRVRSDETAQKETEVMSLALHIMRQKLESNNNPSNKKTQSTSYEMPAHLRSMNPIIRSNEEDAMINECTKKDYKVNIIIRNRQTKREFASYSHAIFLSPPVTTFVKAIKNEHFSTWL